MSPPTHNSNLAPQNHLTNLLCFLSFANFVVVHSCLPTSGNMTDCCVLAAMASLKSFRRPDVTVVGTTVTVHPPAEQQPVPLALHHTPISNTFAVFEGTS